MDRAPKSPTPKVLEPRMTAVAPTPAPPTRAPGTTATVSTVLPRPRPAARAPSAELRGRSAAPSTASSTASSTAASSADAPTTPGRAVSGAVSRPAASAWTDGSSLEELRTQAVRLTPRSESPDVDAASTEALAGRPSTPPAAASSVFVLLETDGTVGLATPEGRAWIDREGLAEGLRAAVALLLPDPSGSFWVRSHGGTLRIQLTRLEGPRGEHYLAQPEPDPPRTRALLTPTQRRIVDQMILGERLGAIARSLGVSPETVKTHVKAIYGRLAVGSRLELVRLLQG